MKNGIRVAICIMLIVTVLTMSLSVFADYEVADTDEQTFTEWYAEYGSESEDFSGDAWGTLGVYGIWAILNSLGVSISVDGVQEWSEEVYVTMENEIVDYLSQFPSMNYTRWILPWQFGFTSSGLFQGNNSMLEDVEDFLQFLKSKYHLYDNGSFQLNAFTVIPVINEDGVPVYLNAYSDFYPYYPEWRFNVYDVWTGGFLLGSIYQLGSGYYCQVYDDNAGKIKMRFSTDPAMQSLVNDIWLCESEFFYATFENPYPVGNVKVFNGTNRVPVVYIPPGVSYNADSYWLVSHADYTNNPNGKTEFNYYGRLSKQQFEQYFYPQVVGNDIQTGEIIIPSQDPDYTPGDMIVIDGTPIYISQEFPESISVDNLPAIVSQGTVSNPGLETFWGFIPVLAEQTKDAVVLARGLIYELPEELVVTFYSVMGGLILFGIIKLMREH